MTELDLTGLTLIFPLYLMFILLAFALFGKYVTHKRVSNFYQQINITRVFATLLLLCYASVMETCIAVLTILPVTIDRV